MQAGAVSTSTYMSAIARRTARRAWWLPILATAVIATGPVFHDIRIAIIGLMLLFIIYPMIMSFTVMRFATLPHLAERTLANIFSLQGDIISLSQTNTDEESGEVSVRELGKFKITGVSHSGNKLIFNTGAGIADIIIAPADAVDKSELTALESRLQENDFVVHED